MKAKYPNKTDEDINEFLETMGASIPTAEEDVVYMTPELARKKKPLTIRSMILGMALKDAGVDGWQRIASLYV